MIIAYLVDVNKKDQSNFHGRNFFALSDVEKIKKILNINYDNNQTHAKHVITLLRFPVERGIANVCSSSFVV